MAASYWKALSWRYPVENLHAALPAQLYMPQGLQQTRLLTPILSVALPQSKDMHI